MPSNKRVFTLRLSDDDYGKMRYVAENNNRSMANYIEWLCKNDIAAYEKEHGEIIIPQDEQ